MLKQLASVTEYMDFIRDLCGDQDCSDPMLQGEEQLRRNLLDAPGRSPYRVWGTFEGDKLIGLFSFLILEEESYLEMLAGLTRVKTAWEELLACLKADYPGYEADFVFNPRNNLLHTLLLAEKAEFDPEQQKMVLKRAVPCQSSRRAALYSAPIQGTIHCNSPGRGAVLDGGEGSRRARPVPGAPCDRRRPSGRLYGRDLCAG